jgi:DNA-binding response OmpR family regulator
MESSNKTLVVEANKAIAESLAGMIASLGFQCDVAADG